MENTPEKYLENYVQGSLFLFLNGAQDPQNQRRKGLPRRAQSPSSGMALPKQFACQGHPRHPRLAFLLSSPFKFLIPCTKPTSSRQLSLTDCDGSAHSSLPISPDSVQHGLSGMRDVTKHPSTFSSRGPFFPQGQEAVEARVTVPFPLSRSTGPLRGWPITSRSWMRSG